MFLVFYVVPHYSAVIAHGDLTTLDEMVTLYKASDHMEEKVRMLRVMGGSDKEEIIKKVLDFSLTVSFIWCSVLVSRVIR